MRKQIIGISALTFDLIGARTLWLDPQSAEQMNQGYRRATRTKTLDGGAVVYDAGFAVADQTFSLKLRGSGSYVGAWVAYMVKTYNLIRISTKDGVYKCVPHRWSEADGVVTLEALVMEKLT